MEHHSIKRIEHRESFAKTVFPKIVLLVALLVVGLVFVVRSGILTVRQFVVHGDDNVLVTGIGDYLLEEVTYIVTSQKDIEYTLLVSYPELKEVDVTVNFIDRTLTIIYEKRAKRFLWCDKTNTCHLTDEQGMLFKESDLIEATFFTNVQDNYFENLAINTRIPFEYTKALLTIEEALLVNEINVKYFVIESPFSVKAIIEGNIEIRFTLQNPVTTQLEHFQVFYDSIDKDEFAGFRYVDLRIKNRIHYQ
jgi:hypothetical protein